MSGRLRVERPRLPVPVRLSLRVDGRPAPWGRWVEAGPEAQVDVGFAAALPAGGCIGTVGCRVAMPPGGEARLSFPDLGLSG